MYAVESDARNQYFISIPVIFYKVGIKKAERLSVHIYCVERFVHLSTLYYLVLHCTYCYSILIVVVIIKIANKTLHFRFSRREHSAAQFFVPTK